MKINTKERYGLRALVTVATDATESKPISIQSLATDQNLSPEYLEKMFAKFKKAQIIGSKKGMQGGYYLLKHPKDISLFEIMSALDGTIGISDTIDSELPIFRIINQSVWAEINKDYLIYLKSHYLIDVKENDTAL